MKYIFTGILFGIIMSKSEAISWYRIQEMFRFQSFHMYGIIGTAVIAGILGLRLNKTKFPPKDRVWKRYLFGGIIFGTGWALTGACPGPIFVLIGQGYSVMLIVLAGALLGTFSYGLLKDRLPH
ncbi:DUF6691 family protein [Chitinophaga tropicalis]|uniref:YeeE/YedE family protein n=1 Tax=Chitinophaga tropicalis TaxID=2683588 RepID=A0A7K1U4X1_9BACT|nr:DUF6691 family protein [Chitinophaga tropicalis]MVT09379.1 YeeE/YedE family protein [Chitinophaga tropicalis]